MRTLYVVVAVVAIIYMAIFAIGQPKGEIIIGVSAPSTGPVALVGMWAVQGVELAIEDVNTNGGINGRQLRLVIEDDKCNANEGVKTLNKLVQADMAKIIVVYCGAVTGAATTIAENKSIIYSISIRTEPLEGKYPFLFNMAPSPEREVELIAAHMVLNNITRVALLHQSDFFGETYKNKFKRAFSDRGGTVIVEGSLDNFQNPDFRSDLLKAKALDVQAIFTSFNQAHYSVILKQSKEIGLGVKFYSVWNTESVLMLNLSGDLAEGVIYTYSFQGSEEDNYKKFRNIYMEHYGKEPEYNAANGYDTIMIVSTALKQCGEDIECIQNVTANIKEFSGVSGQFGFVNGSADKGVFFKTIKGGTFVKYGG